MTSDYDFPARVNKDDIYPQNASETDERVVANYVTGKVEIYFRGDKPSETLNSVAHTYLLKSHMKEGTKIQEIRLPDEDITDILG